MFGPGSAWAQTPAVSLAPVINTVAGTVGYGYNGDSIAATSAELWAPYGVAVDGAGNLYIADIGNNLIRKVTPGGIITTVAGNGTYGYNGDNIAAASAELGSPTGVAVDSAGNLYIADIGNNRIRKVDVSDAPSLTFAATNIGAASAPQDVTVLNLGNDALIISQISTPAGFSLQGPDTTCSSTGQTLNPAASCLLGIEFNPTASGGFSGGVTLADNTLNVGASTQTINLQGTGTGVQPLYLNVSTLAFGNQGLNVPSAAKTVYLYNYSGSALVAGAISVVGTVGPFTAALGTCASGVANNGSCTITVSFTPAANGAVPSTSLNVQAGSTSLPLSATGKGV
jgi:hypothetical protein